MKDQTCPNCGTVFRPWMAGRIYCSARCRKIADNKRSKKVAKRSLATLVAADQKLPKSAQQYQGASHPEIDVDPPPSPMAWLAVNSVTQKFVREGGRGDIAGWVMYVDRQQAWFGRVRDERGDYAVGPCNLNRARRAVETRIRHEPFDKIDDEREWRGDCMALL